VDLFPTRAKELEFHFIWNSAKAAPTFLFHYTGNVGLRGIVKTTSVWATDARFLNDTQEVQIAIEAAREVVKSTAKTSAKALAALLSKEILIQLHLDPKSLYVFSLAENGDSLTHWRGYCKEGAGYAVGFKFEELADWCEANGLNSLFRDGAFSLIPYTILKFEPATFFGALGIINVKPSEHATLCSEGLRDFIRSEASRHGLRETKSLLTEISAIPFRPGF
jgi:hypothetical protein